MTAPTELSAGQTLNGSNTVGVDPRRAADPYGKRLVSPQLIGRSEELERLVAVVSESPAVVVVEGEAGVGKTRLLSELRARPEVADRRFVVGACRRIREPFPLGPLLDAVRSLGDDLTRVSLSPVAGALRPLLPEVAHVLPPLPEALGDRAAERHRVFRGLVEVFASLGPVVLALEDMHWADEHTADFVSYLVADQPPTLALVLTFRGEEVAAEVRALTAKLPESVGRTHVALTPLDADQTGALAAAILGLERVSAEFAGHLCAKAAGLPFAIEELLALLQARGSLVRRDGGWARRDLDELGVPTGIRDPVLERVSRLSDGARSVVEAAAVLQTPVPASVLGRTSLPKTRARRGVDDALESGLLVDNGDLIGFRHVLAAQAVYDGLPGPRRQELHARAASALDALDPVPLGQLAHHLRYASRLDAWVETAERAADQAVELGHHDEAARLLADVLRHASLDVDRLGRLAVKLGRAAAQALHGSQEIARLLSDLLEQDLPPIVRGELRFWLVVQLQHAGRLDPRQQRRLLAEAVDELDDLPALKVRAMVALGYANVPGVALSEHRRWLYGALEILPTVADPGARALAAGKVAMVLAWIGDREWRPLTDRIVEQTSGTPRNHQEVVAYLSIGEAACYAGHLSPAERLLTAALEGATACASRQLEFRARSAQALLAYCRGAWDGLGSTVEFLTDQLADLASGRIELDGLAGCLAVTRGDLDSHHRLHEVIGRGEEISRSELLILPTCALIRQHVGRGDPASAMAVVDRFLAVVESVPFAVPVVRALPHVTEAMVAAGQLTEPEALVTRWARKLRDLDAPLADAALPHARGFLAKTASNWALAARLFATAAAQYDSLGFPYEATQAREQAASSLLASDDGSVQVRGQEMLLAARASYQLLGATWDAARAADLARKHGISVPSQHRGGRRGYGNELSPREREVAALVAKGRTNKETAAELFVSVKTIEGHVSTLMRKLGVSSRRSIASRLAEIGQGTPEQ